MNRKTFALLCLFFLSRIYFANPLAVFFDSPEYLSRFSNPNYFQAIASGHIPFHAGYIAIFWPVFQVAVILGINPSFAVIFSQVILSAIGIYCFFQLTSLILNKKAAFIASIIAATTPLYWITNISIMMESAYINLFLISLFLLIKYTKSKTNSKLSLLLGSFIFGFAFFTHPLIILWLPFVLALAYIFNKRKILTTSLIIIITILIFGILNILLIAKSQQITFINGAHIYFFDKLIEHVQIGININSLFIISRNTIIPLLRNNTTLIVLISIISLGSLFKKNKKLFTLGLLWILPSIIANQWWDSLLFGRHSLIAGFGLAILVATFLENRKILTIVVITYILVVSLPALILLKQSIPYLEEQQIVKALPRGLLIDSHFARPQIQGIYLGEIFFVNEPGYNKNNLEIIINKYLSEQKPIFITSQALSDPYGLYSGPYLHSLSLSYSKKFELKDILSSYSLKKYITDENTGIIIYRIISKEKSQYPDIPILKYNKRRLDYFDPINQLWFFIDRAKIIQSQSMIKG